MWLSNPVSSLKHISTVVCFNYTPLHHFQAAYGLRCAKGSLKSYNSLFLIYQQNHDHRTLPHLPHPCCMAA